ncbi:MAG TPA: hypothetical protein VL634_20740 [Mycobacterium sp.]|jgi:hypothetical protein|nr:hypothetical protein [Mycobacterium sp.]
MGSIDKPFASLTMVERDDRIVKLKREGKSFQQIADELGISKSGAILGFQRVKARVNERADANYEAYRDEQLARIATMRAVVEDVVHAKHVTISNGHVVSRIIGEDEETGRPIYGEPYEDDAPVLAAVDRMIKLDEREAKLLGLDAKTEMDHTGTITIEFIGVDPNDL